MKENTIHIGIADDHTLLRKTLRTWLSHYNEFKVTIEASTGYELLQKLENYSVDVLILDLFMPNIDGKESLQVIQHKYPGIKVIILSMYVEPEMVSELLDLGIYGYLSKSAETTELLDAIKEASKGIVHQNQIVTKALYWKTNNSAQVYSTQNGSSFTEKQKKILQLLWEEKSTQEIASEVFLSVSAVDKIKQQLKEKTGAKTTVGLLKYAIEKKIISPLTQFILSHNTVVELHSGK